MFSMLHSSFKAKPFFFHITSSNIPLQVRGITIKNKRHKRTVAVSSERYVSSTLSQGIACRPHLITSGLGRAFPTAIAFFTSYTAVQIPKAVGALVTLNTNHIRQALTLPCLVVASIVKAWDRAICVTNALCGQRKKGFFTRPSKGTKNRCTRLILFLSWTS